MFGRGYSVVPAQDPATTVVSVNGKMQFYVDEGVSKYYHSGLLNNCDQRYLYFQNISILLGSHGGGNPSLYCSWYMGTRFRLILQTVKLDFSVVDVNKD